MAIIKKSSTQNFETKAHSGASPLTVVKQDIERLGLNFIPLEINAVIAHYGIQIVYEDMEDDLSGYIEKRSGNFQYIIGLNKYQSPRRHRFTLAHELGHFFMHRECIDSSNLPRDKILLRSNDSNAKIEEEANEFASELLMPKLDFLKIISEGTRDISQLADRFEVSIAAIRYRAFTLGLIKNK